MSPLRSLGNPDFSPFDDVFSATGKRYAFDGPPPVSWYGDRALFMGGYNPNTNKIDYVEIALTGNASDFGDLNHSTRAVAPASNGSRGLAMGGRSSSPGPDTAVDYVTIGTTGNATDFGDSTTNAGQGYAAGSSNGTRALLAGGDLPGTVDIEYFTIATPGNGTDLADLTVSRYGLAGCSNGDSRAVFGGQYSSGDTIDYKNFETANCTDFGNLTNGRGYIGAGQNDPAGRGFFSGGSSKDNIDYITIASAGNATNFGDALNQEDATSATSNATRGIIAGNGGSGDYISYITISSTGNATDFGDLTTGRGYIGATSGD
tara:strand:+ start:1278 stop:2231 length:954 start_codon:yes stop_codon:yes gene_type:complete